VTAITAMASSGGPRPATPRPAPWFGGSMPVARLGLIVNLLVPMALLAWDARHHHLGADAVNFAIHTTGGVAVVCLLLSLAVTPLRKVTGWPSLVQFRRSLGVYAFYYACAHLAIYFWWDRQRSLSSTVEEIVHRRYLTIGFASLALMAPLWATSFNRAIRWMGGTWWKRLHRLAYVAAGLACWHFYLQVKSDHRLPWVAIDILAGLMLWRAVTWTVAVVHWARTPTRSAAGFPVMPAAAAKARSWRGELRVVGMFRETPSVRTFRLAPPDGGPVPFAFRAGQFLNLMVDVDGRRVGRSYTIASPPTRDGYVELTVKREEHGHVSRFLHDMLMTGHSVAVSAPAGRFTFDPGKDLAKEPGVVLVAGGVGVTPVMSILRDLTDRCWAGKIDLVFSVRTPADVIFADELRYLAGRHPNLHVHVAITRDAPPDWPGPRGRVTAELLRQLVPDLAQRRAFVCGPDAMADAARAALVEAGVPAERVTLESFTPAAATPAPAGDAGTGTFTATFARSDKTAPLPGNQTVLDAAESAGVAIDFQCRSGVCGTCRTRLVSGQVTMPVRDALSDADEADGYILACQAHATGDVTVDA
jgi:ferredoxin-NADP reductase/DMSO/TMAO reductase YedYZ heme-binding membrane subunit